MDAANNIQRAFEALLERMDYKNITVSALCNEAGVSRKTFYAHYADKLEVFDAIAEADFLQPVRDLRKLLDIDNMKSSTVLMSERSAELMYEKRAFYAQVFSVRNRELMDRYIERTVELNRSIYALHGLDEEEALFAARMVAVASADATAQWMAGGCTRTPAQHARLCSQWFYAHFRELQSNRTWGKG